MQSSQNRYVLEKGCTNFGSQVARKSKFCTVVSNICGFSVWSLFHVTLLASKILSWILDFWKVYEHPCYKFVYGLPLDTQQIMDSAAVGPHGLVQGKI
jgi:hypothetical protein